MQNQWVRRSNYIYSRIGAVGKKIVLENYGDKFKRKFKLFIDVKEDTSISMKMKNTYHRNVLE